MKRVLFLSTRDNAPVDSDRKKVISHLADVVRSEDVETYVAMLEELIFTIENGKAAVWDGRNARDLAEYDLVYIKNWKALESIASAAVIYLRDKKVRFICSELQYFRVVDKTAEAFLLAMNDVPYPDTLFTAHAVGLARALAEKGDYLPFPVIMKAADGSAGQDNYLVQNNEELQAIVDTDPQRTFLLQGFIPNDGDHRVILFNFKPTLSFKRMRVSDDTHLNNTSQGGSADRTSIEDYSRRVIDDAIRASRLVNREVAGVDVLFNKETGQHVILEVNASPQLSTGAFLDEKAAFFREFIHEIVNEKVENI